MSTSKAPVDVSALQDLRQIMGEDFELLIEVFVNDSRKRLLDIAKAIELADADRLRTSAHGFKGSALNISAARLTSLCQQLETMGRDQQLQGAQVILHQLGEEFEQVRLFLAQLS